MESIYTIDIAEHYSAYRPPLHQLILEKCIEPGEHFQNGLDVGSGTGQSSIALAKYCSRVTGIEPSEDMLRMAIPHPLVSYSPFDGKKLPFPDRSFDVITFAGSLFYGKSQELLDEVLRVSRDNSTILIYDFEVMYDNLFAILNITPPADPSNYDHATDFSGLKSDGLEKCLSAQQQITFELTAPNLAHLLLSYKNFPPIFMKKYGRAELYARLADDLENYAQDGTHQLPVQVYYCRYQYERARK